MHSDPFADLMPTFTFSGQARWIWGDREHTAPFNRFTWFRHVVQIDAMPANTRVLFAADSNAWLWINGHVLRRKVARYHEPAITGELIEAGPWLRQGANVIVVLHHNWGDTPTFQRSGNAHAGLFFDSAWAVSDGAWHWQTARQFHPHEDQIIGIVEDARRIRYPVVLDARQQAGPELHDPQWTPDGWSACHAVTNGPWPAQPEVVETPGQRESLQPALSVLAAGQALAQPTRLSGMYQIAEAISGAECLPDAELTRQAARMVGGGAPLTLQGKAGSRHYITVDFQRPVHGFLQVELADATPGVTIDTGYAEVAVTQYEGRYLVKENGWLDTQGITGKGYADRMITRAGAQCLTLPDERTARWLTLHVQFGTNGSVTLEGVRFIKSQYPIQPLGSFNCGDERIERIVKLCLVHAEVTMSDTYVDTPGREDGQWIEDDRPRALVAERWFGDARLRRLLIRTFSQGQGSDGGFHPFFPSNFPTYPAPYDWSVQWVAALYDDWMWTGRRDYVERFFGVMERYWENVLARVDARGLWIETLVNGDIRNSMVPTRTGSSGIITPWMIERLKWSAAMATAIGRDASARTWRAAAEQLTESFQRYHVVRDHLGLPVHVADRYEDDATLPRGISQAGQLIAILGGLLSDEEAAEALDFTFAAPDGAPPAGVTRWNNPTWSYRALRALSLHGFGERALLHLIERYAPYLPAHPRNTVPLALQGPDGGPLPEYWVSREDLGLQPGEINYPQPPDETGSHGWGCVPLLWLHDSLLGVRIIEPGGARLVIEPCAAGLPFVSGTTCTPRGPVMVHYEPQTLELEVRLPAGVEAEVRLPREMRGCRVEYRGPEGKPQQGPGTGAFAAQEMGLHCWVARAAVGAQGRVEWHSNKMHDGEKTGLTASTETR